MLLYFHKSCIRRVTVSLKAQLDTFRAFANEPLYPQEADEKAAFCTKTITALENALSLIGATRSELLSILDTVKKEYADTKKADKKEFLDEFQAIEEDTAYGAVVLEADALITALKTRLREIQCELAQITDRREKELSSPKTNEEPNQEKEQSITYPSSMTHPANTITANPGPIAQENSEPRLHHQNNIPQIADSDNRYTNEWNSNTHCNTIKPPQINLPRFSGNLESFQEYWAVYDTMVHSNRALNTMEKMIMLKESLVDKAAMTIKGIKMAPENYAWMIETIKKKYANTTATRANVIKRLTALRPARNGTDIRSCEAVFDEIRSLINEMTSSGYAISETHDPMWIETILKKLPRNIVEEYLKGNKGEEFYTVGETLDRLEVVIRQNAYVVERLGYQETLNRPDYGTNLRSKVEEGRKTYHCHFCERSNHQSYQCRTVRDANARRKTVMEKSLCWKCFAQDHKSSDCRRPNCKRCGKLHDKTLCLSKETNIQSDRAKQSNSKIVQNVIQMENMDRDDVKSERETPTDPESYLYHTLYNATMCTTHSNQLVDTNPIFPEKSEQIVLMTAEGSVWNYAANAYERALFFFDTGAQVSLVSEQSAQSLGLPVLKSEQCSLSGISGFCETFLSHQVVLRVQSAQGRVLEFPMKTKATITKGFPSAVIAERDMLFMEANNIYLANSKLHGEHQLPHILIGLDHYSSFVVEHSSPIRLPTGLRVAKTLFGFAAYGRGKLDSNVAENYVKSCNTVISEAEMIRNIFELEGLGISTKEGSDDETAYAYLAKYAKSIKFENNYVVAPFPLKENIVDLSDNYNMALRRLIAQVKHLNSLPERKQWYVKILQEYLADDIIEEAIDPVPDSVGTYYMPHSGVWKEHKSTPLRIVFDASSKQRGKLSLNDVIYTGASFVNKIHDILIASREKSIILIADIQAAFTQIRIQQSHRDLCRFIWLRDPERPPTHDNLIEYRWKRVPFGITASPSMLNMVISAYLSSVRTPLANELLRLLYVDNVLMTAECQEEAILKYHESKKIFAAIGMNLRAYVSNSPVVNSQIADVDKAPYKRMKLLGVDYDPATDTFSLNTSLSLQPHTKRDFLRQHHSVYDPIGLGAPLMINQKYLLRKLFESYPEWNTIVDDDFKDEWKKVTKHIDACYIEIPRRLASTKATPSNGKLWVFADASCQAMAVCAYLEDHNSTEVSSLISGKTKLAPRKRILSIPKLELLAILIALRLAESIVSAISASISEVNIASDSLIALSWIKSPRKLPLFISNQKDRIRTIINKFVSVGCECHLFHVPGERNPADVGTRGATGSQLRDLDWIKGPQWLLEEHGKTQLTSIDSIEACDTLNAQEEDITTVPLLEIQPKLVKGSNSLLDLQRFSSFTKVLRITAFVGKFIAKLAKRVSQKGKNINLSNIPNFTTTIEITAEDMDSAEKTIIRDAHKSLNIEELQKRFPDKLLFQDDKGIVRCESRIQNASLPYDTRNPIFVPARSPLMRLILHDIHIRSAHCGRNHLLALARQRFWMAQPSRSVQAILKSCTTCQRAQSLSFRTPKMASLPPDRVRRAKAFENVGCDFMGPFLLKDNSKAYVCIFTCLTTRAIHLELVENLTAEGFLHSFIRFVSRRGVPSLVRSDCGTNFVLGKRVIDSLFDYDVAENSIANYCAKNRIKWLFNPAGAPWMGGVWERLVSSVKIAYQKSVGKRRLSLSQLNTLVTRIEAIINTRPLTAISTSDVSVLALRPVDFLQGNVHFSLPPCQSCNGDYDDDTYDPDCLQTVAQVREALKNSEYIADRFWEIWNIEYLSLLRDSQKSRFKERRNNSRPLPEKGEIVLIEHDLLPRGHWNIGRVEELIRGADGLVRSAKIRIPFRKVFIQRPIGKLYPLEIRATPDTHREENPNNQDIKRSAKEGVSTSATRESQRPLRVAKKKAFDALHEIRQREELEEIMEEPVIQATPKLYLHLLLTIAMMLCGQVSASPPISCTEGMVTVHRADKPYTLCFDDQCRNFSGDTIEAKHVLLPSMYNTSVRVVVRSQDFISKQACLAAPYCVTMAFLSKNLLGNPHCWPVGAILSAALLLYMLLAMILLLCWLVVRTRHALPSVLSNNTTIELSSMNLQRESTPFSLTTFTPAALPALRIIAISVTILGASLTTACQDGYMRHSIELSCSNRSSCYYEYRQEILFNRVQKNLCVQLRHHNTSVGFINIRRVSEYYTCSKLSKFWSRETAHQIRHITRCRGMGSCTSDNCESLRPSDIVPELNDTKIFPGYSACSIQCSGADCLCAIPFRACTFYRLFHVPQSQQVYENFECMTWTPKIEFEVHTQIYNSKREGRVTLTPYTKKSFADFEFTIISQQMQPIEMGRTFAQSPTETLILPKDFAFPVTCMSRFQAQNNFSSCVNAHSCECDVTGMKPSCRCPYRSLAELRHNSDLLLPLSTPLYVLWRKGNSVIAETNYGETTVAITSRKELQGAHLDIKLPCVLHVGTINGCYSCKQGSVVELTCFAVAESWTTVTCAHNTFSIECNPRNRSTQVRLHFENAIIDSFCHTSCGDRNVHVALRGTLFYHPFTERSDAFIEHTSKSIPQLDWFSDLHLPDLAPLILVLAEHWRIALMAAGLLLILLVLTYLFGPIVLLTLCKIMGHMTLLIVQLTAALMRTILCTLCTCASSIHRLKSALQRQNRNVINA